MQGALLQSKSHLMLVDRRNYPTSSKTNFVSIELRSLIQPHDLFPPPSGLTLQGVKLSLVSYLRLILLNLRDAAESASLIELLLGLRLPEASPHTFKLYSHS